MTLAKAVKDASRILILGPQEQYFGLIAKMPVCELTAFALRIGGHFIECEMPDNSQRMYSLDGALIRVWR